jgi:epoxide hydrolase-like predicted phosphatase
MIKAIIWDLAGVLLHTVRGSFESLLAERLNASQEAVHQAIRSEQNNRWDLGEMEDEDFYAWLLQTLGQPLEKLPIVRKFVRDDFYVQPDMLAYIRKLHQNYTSLLLTNFPSHLHEFLETVWYIEGAFDAIIASCDVKLLKPDPRMYQYALEKAGCEAAEAVFIDDREINVAGARSIGMHAILYRDRQQIMHDLDHFLLQEK